ncbi:hybrid sensor histidine kinase/response regulator [Megalodesulfovibrio gigas]|uniref:histidine kinase n=1 Tax=Megalodesulfovibrio gigas (strain ATCC 19364 / DSM 1382 / NCIMB 9332 / VKM B-1759) TaxID=1121448 RepID=T2GAA1_MEGG1|nr:ATP-binding protein [Megalodesulfovibrio gigas]AGW13525.1 putative sensory box histidine kinase and response regulator protein [Megalodesulfovibrio gigas DSM 1382 = ATCC 19364]
MQQCQTASESILLVDDEAGVRKVLGLTLRDMGFLVIEAADGDQALAHFASVTAQGTAAPPPPAIVVTDVRMPGKSGLEVLEAIKAVAPETEVIIVTGHGDMDLAIKGLQLGAADFLPKPVSDGALEVAVARALERIETRRQLHEYTCNLEALAQSQASRLVAMERQLAARQVVEGLSQAFSGVAADLQDGLSVLDELPCFVALHDRDGRIVSVNQRYRERLGDPTGESAQVRDGWAIYKDGATRKRALPVPATFFSDAPRRVHEVLLCKEGNEIPVVVHTAPIRTSTGETVLVMELAVDMGELKRLQTELAATREHLASLGLVVASLSHGVKGLLTALDGALYAMEAGLERNDMPRMHRGFEQTKDVAGRIKTLILDILFCAKRREPERKVLELRRFGRETLNMVREKAERLGVQLVLDAPEPSDESSQPSATFAADPTLLAAALVNLLENAIEACAASQSTADDGRARTVTLRCRRVDGRVRIDVQDTGPGMDESTRNKLFQVFFSTKGSNGTGLGLFITRHAVLAHGGSIAVDSTPGQGSCFRIELPLAPGDTTAQDLCEPVSLSSPAA